MRLSPLVIVLTIVAVLVAGAAAYYFMAPGAQDIFRATQTIDDTDTINDMVLGYVSAPYPNDYGVTRVTGWLDNNSKSEIHAATISIQLLDEDGNKKERLEYVIEDVPANSRKTFDLNAGTISGSRTATIAITKVEVFK